MFRLLPWPSAIGGNKIMAEEVKMIAPSGCAPGVNALSLPKLKRKRSASTASDAPASTKLRTSDSTASIAQSAQPTPSPSVAPPLDPASSSPVAPTSSVATARPPAQAAARITDVNHLRDTITAQLSLEVLLKHNELRLIDQEIAKCQVALEQLRRCAEIPYPGSVATGISADVSAGTGASVLPPGNGLAPVSPAPWGVTEGPYSRHYARWLLPDPRFDGGEVDPALSAAAGTGLPQAEGRSTRGNPQDYSSLAGKTRTSRNSSGSKLQALGNQVAKEKEKEKAGPIFMRRKCDGVMVKLLCLDCDRVNFYSTQGFINHCRIAHNRNYVSHEAAAIECGVPVEVDDTGAVVGGQSESTPIATTPANVHPLIHSPLPASSRATNLPTPRKEAVTPRKQSVVNAASAVATPPATVKAARQPRRKSETAKTANSSFLASPATPHLSALIQKRGMSLDIDKLVAEAKTPVDLSGLSDDESDEYESGSFHASASCGQDSSFAVPKPQPMRMPAAQTASQRPDSRKALDHAAGAFNQPQDLTPSRPQPQHQTCLTALSLSAASQAFSVGTPRDADGMDHPAHLSPNTIESNQAPSLVSDYEDDFGAASESESSSSSEDEEDQEFRHIEVEDDERAVARTAAAAEGKPGPALTNPHPQTAAPLSKPIKQNRSSNLAMAPKLGDRDHDDQRRGLVHSTEDASNPKQPNVRRPAPASR
ncbi:uncharacterized protein N7459_003618 [Penicillium hispanicum]|uniref:uncharacterized protein n=1 Tax=Penicillium hispanicum TaxID=1080232 RepID=UPI00254159DE|nr:uncharacterized protein N7459_003618 [Penicillium hispanicum]KAJ5587853.1 hypothetical protein N7459_003618 [Penicillium hispanicum]